LYRFDYNETKILRCYIERPLLSKADVQDLALGFSFTNDRFTPYSVEKLRITTTGKSNGISRSPGARITDQLCRSELRQAGFSCHFCYPPSYIQYATPLKSQIKSASISKQSFSTEYARELPFAHNWSEGPPKAMVIRLTRE
jgi:hypothetical protein